MGPEPRTQASRQTLAPRCVKMVTIPAGSGPIIGHAELHSLAEEPRIMAMPAPNESITTIEQLMSLPEDNARRHELLDGVYVVSPTPRRLHQRAVLRLHHLLLPAFESRTDLELCPIQGDIKLGPRTVVEPDLFVVHRPADDSTPWIEVGIPPLVVEVLSRSTASRDRGIKRREYQRAGVHEYWIVDLDARLVERWTPRDVRPEILDEELVWSLPEGPSGRVELPRYFESVFGSQIE